jgi:hypothetical protein
MQINVRLTWRHALAAVLVILALINIGRLYQREGEKHTLLFVGTRHVWRYGLQTVKDVRWQFVENYPWCRSEGGSVSGCLAKAGKRSVNAVFTDRPVTLARQFAGLESPFIIPEEGTAAGCIAAVSSDPSRYGKLSQAPVAVLLEVCGAEDGK